MTLKRCRDAFAFNQDGVPRVVAAGALVEDTDPAVTVNPAAFEDAQQFVTRSTASAVERATAGPGERRTLGRPKGRAAKDSGEG